jgi:hypothetical protein
MCHDLTEIPSRYPIGRNEESKDNHVLSEILRLCLRNTSRQPYPMRQQAGYDNIRLVNAYNRHRFITVTLREIRVKALHRSPPPPKKKEHAVTCSTRHGGGVEV